MISIARRLSAKVGIAVILVEIVALSLMGTFYVRRFNEEIDKRVVGNLQLPGLLMSRGLLSYESASDKKTLESLVDEELVDCLIVGLNEMVFYSLDPAHVGRNINDIMSPENVQFIENGSAYGEAGSVKRVESTDGVYLVSTMQLRTKDGAESKPIGHLYLKVRATRLAQEKRGITMLFVVGSISCVTVNSLMIMVALYYMVLGRVVGLQRVVSRLEAGNLNERIGGERSRDELGTLERGVNSMASQLEETIDRLEQRVAELKKVESTLKETNDELDGRVKQRTLELSDTNEQLKTEIVARGQAAAALREQLELVRKLMDTIPNPIYWKRPNGEYTNCNIAFEKFIGLPREEIVKKHAHDLWPADVVETEVAMDARLLRDARVQTYETSLPAVGGARHPVIITRDAYYNADRSIAGLVGAIIDITERKRAEAEREELNRQLVIASRQAGKAEIATNVLHNVGNVLNGVSVSASLVRDRVRASRLGSVRQIAEMLHAHRHDLAHFFTADERGKQLPRYVEKLVEHLSAERDATLSDLQVLGKNVDHIRHIIALQQRDAGISRMMEQVALVELIEDAIRINATSLEASNIEIVREFVDVQPVMTDQHKVLQILVNLVSNAKTALVESSAVHRRLVVRLEMIEGQMRVQVRDNGVGISAENLKRIFQHGFTTRKEGHGFGLHSGSLAAQELGGRLTVESDGLGTGAAFTLILPAVVQGERTA